MFFGVSLGVCFRNAFIIHENDYLLYEYSQWTVDVDFDTIKIVLEIPV